jgi:tetratricopeptide (TPR) repeat protein
MAETLSGKGELEEGLTYVQKAMRLDPASAHFYSDEAGSLYNKMGRYKKALASLTAGDADDPWVHVELIYTYTELDREEDARAEAKEVLRLSPRFALGTVYYRSPEYWNTAFGRHFLDDLLKAGLE